MNKNILELINDKETIGYLFEKTGALKSENKLQNEKIKNIFLIILLILYIFCFVFQFFILKEKFENITELLTILIFSSLVPTALITLFAISINIIISEYHYIKNLDIDTMYKKKNKNKILKFEKNLNEKELEYYNAMIFKTDISEYEYFLYNNYIKAINNTNLDLIIENKTIILDNIKENFNEQRQKSLFKEIVKTIKRKDVKKDLDEIDNAINNLNTNKTTIENT